jgi:hypothetical protein
MGAGLGRIAQFGHADHAEDHRTDQRCAFEGDGRKTREVGEQSTILLGESLRGVGEQQHSEHLAGGGAQRLGQHAAEGRVDEAFDEVAADSSRLRIAVGGEMHDLAGERRAAGDAFEGDRQRIVTPFVAGNPLVEAVLQGEGVAVADEDRPRRGTGESAGVAEDALEQQVEVLDRGEFGAGRGDRVQPRLPLAHVVGEVRVHLREAPVGLVEAAVLLAHLAGHGLELDERAAALPFGDEAGGVMVQSSLQLDGIGKLHEIVARTAGERLRLGGGFLPGAQHHHRHVGEGLVGAVGLEQIETVRVGHHEILQDDRRPNTSCRLERGGTLEADVKDDAVVVGKHPPHRLADHRLVVDEQDRGKRAGTGRRHGEDATGGSPDLCCEA